MGKEGALCLFDRLTFDLEGLATATRQVRHLKVKRSNVAHRLPRGKRASETEIKHFQKQQRFTKRLFIMTFLRCLIHLLYSGC
ncbi:hypothetical protein P8610_17845 [Fictibacillus sp. UD]|uniref:hypothetical protein n=1 Tax=Fictibacillus sp. UD TaxID=3038777 RepID=UPI0037472104